MIAIFGNKKVLYILVGYLPLSISLIFTPIYTHYLSIEDYGFLNLFNTLIGLIAPILHLGIKDGFGFLYWKHNTNKESSDLFFRRSFSSLIGLQLVTSILFLVIGHTILKHFFSFLNQDQYKNFLYILLFYAFFLNINDLFFYYFRNEDKLKKFLILNLATVVCMTIGSFVGIILLKMGLDGAIYGKAIGFIVVILFFVIENCKHFKIEFHFVKEIFVSGLPILVSTIIGAYASNMDKYFLQKYFDLGTLGLYGMAVTIIYLIDILLISFSHFLLPDTINKIKNNSSKLEIQGPIKDVFIMLILFIFLILTVSPLVIKIFPLEYNNVLLYLPFLAVNPIIKFWYTLNTLNFYFYNNSTIFLKVQLISFVLTIMIMQIIPLKLSIDGAIIITLLNTIFQLLVSSLFSRKRKSFSVNDATMFSFSFLSIALLIALGLVYRMNLNSFYYPLAFIVFLLIFIAFDFSQFKRLLNKCINVFTGVS
jgi:O-antigen/teichoic acid export membrane protein